MPEQKGKHIFCVSRGIQNARCYVLEDRRALEMCQRRVEPFTDGVREIIVNFDVHQECRRGRSYSESNVPGFEVAADY